MLDIGTGDGLFVYRSARENPDTLFIGIDANSRPLAKISEKIYRRPSKGGLPNALFVQSAVEDLPSELNGIASVVHVTLPWGGLLSAVAGRDVMSLNNIRRICSAHALFRVVLGVDPSRDKAELARLQLPELSLNYIDSTLSRNYREAGFEIIERRILNPAEWREIETSWAKRLRGNTNRLGIYLGARALVQSGPGQAPLPNPETFDVER